MQIETLRSFLFWCAVINCGVLLTWFAIFVFAHERLYHHHTRWFRINREQFDMLLYILTGVYKIGFILFNVVPYIVLLIVS